jgi:RecB family exonuclease
VAELRRTLVDPESPPELRTAAAERLARLADHQVDGRLLVPAADPARWWGTRALTASDRPLRPADQPVAMSASALAGLLECPAKWFLEREAGGESRTSQAQGFGNIAHALADRIGSGELADVTSADDLMVEVDRVWGELTFRTPWSGPREREELRAALARFLGWHRHERGREVVATEEDFRTEVELPDGQRVVLQGRVDRLEVDADGRLVVIDLKTGKYPPTDASLGENPQLGLYQHAVRHGGFEHVSPTDESGGSELWQLRRESRGQLKVQVQPPQAAQESGHTVVEEQLMAAAGTLRSEQLEARPGPQCERCAFRVLCPTQQAGTVLS